MEDYRQHRIQSSKLLFDLPLKHMISLLSSTIILFIADRLNGRQ
jgi:hypothetical protein